MRKHQNRARVWRTVLGGAIALLMTGSAAQAHQVKLSGEVGGTKHIEPDDNPRAGTASLTWFALTRKGGSLIPLADCDCTLAVYREPRQPGDPPVAEPPLRAISAEGYEGIPGADILFPQVGAYTLVLSGKPQRASTFQPFELTFATTVVAGAPSPSPSPSPVSPVSSPVAPTTAPDTPASPTAAPTNNGAGWAIAVGVGLVLGVMGLLVRRGGGDRQKS